ncbi:hypoxic response protein 1 [Marmoricola endophyticus]|uniref:Hypoxic response protein 1 n=1 Tax=Marmoricola endophyticus TaxID=2040280 RepID=A0A917BFC6_9ACTN|nr:CBS domain-containing protein [Marmoricola endophyticus]GGF41384.1 hypoxic response protein 1 [Marmoricola endophyticus]
MLRVAEIMQPDPVCADARTDVVQVARLMRDHGLDQVPVCRGGAYVGMVCLVDVVHHCVAAGLDPATTPVSDVVPADDARAQAETSAEEALLTVLHTGQRCLAVLSGEQLAGTLSYADLVRALPDETVSGILAVVSGS